MATKLFLRDTTTNGVTGGGVTYLDMVTTASAGGETSGSAATTASGTQIQFDDSLGTLIQWISGRAPAGGFTLTTTDISVWISESNMSANCGGRYRVFKRAANGTETELGGGPFNDGVEFNVTTPTELTWTGNVTDTAFAEDDRILVKIYITNVGTMAAGHTCELFFNGVDGVGRDSFFNIAETVAFKAETVAPAGTSAQILHKITQAATGVEKFTGTAAQSLKRIAQSATGVEHPKGSAAQTLNNIEQAAVGREAFTATAAQTLPNIEQSGAGAERFTATAAQTLPSIDQAGAGAERFTATSAAVLPSIEQTATGDQQSPPEGAAAQTLPSVDQSATGAERFTGTGAQELPSIAQSATGIMQPAGTGAQELPSVVQSATGAERVQATSAQTLPSVEQSATGLMQPSGTAAQTLPNVEQAGSGTQQTPVSGTAAQTLPSISQTATGSGAAAIVDAPRASRLVGQKDTRAAGGDKQRRAFAEIDATEATDRAHFDVLSNIVAGIDVIETSDGASVEAALITPAIFEAHEIGDGFDATALCESWAAYDLAVVQLP